MAASPLRNAIPAAQPPATIASARSTPNPLSRIVIVSNQLALRRPHSAIRNAQSAMRSRPTEPNRLPAPPVDVLHFDRFGANADDPVAALDDIAFASIHRPATPVAQHRDPLRLALRFHQADELV